MGRTGTRGLHPSVKARIARAFLVLEDARQACADLNFNGATPEIIERAEQAASSLHGTRSLVREIVGLAIRNAAWQAK